MYIQHFLFTQIWVLRVIRLYIAWASVWGVRILTMTIPVWKNNSSVYLCTYISVGRVMHLPWRWSDLHRDTRYFVYGCQINTTMFTVQIICIQHVYDQSTLVWIGGEISSGSSGALWHVLPFQFVYIRYSYPEEPGHPNALVLRIESMVETSI